MSVALAFILSMIRTLSIYGFSLLTISALRQFITHKKVPIGMVFSWKNRGDIGLAMAMTPVISATWGAMFRGQGIAFALTQVDWIFSGVMLLCAVVFWVQDSWRDKSEA